MKHLFPLTLICLLLLSATGIAQQDTTKREAAKSEIRNVDDFHVVKILGNVHASLKKGKKPSVKVIEWGPEADITKVTTVVKGGELKVESLSPGEKKVVRVEITYVSIDELVADAGGNIGRTDQIESRFLNVKVAKGSMAQIHMKVVNLNADITNGAETYFTGSCEAAEIKVNNGSKLHAYKLVCQEMAINAISGAKAEVQAVERLEAKASLKAGILYLGYPAKLMPKVSTGGTVGKKE